MAWRRCPQGPCDFGLDLSCSLGLQHHPCSCHLSPAEEEAGSDTALWLGGAGALLCARHILLDQMPSLLTELNA